MYEAQIVNWLGRHAEAADIARRGLELTALHGTESGGSVLIWALGTAFARMGHWDETEALPDAPTKVEGTLWIDRALAHVRAEVDVRRGRFERAKQLLDFVARPPSDPSLQVDVHPLRLELAMWERDIAAGRRAIAVALDAASVHRCVLLLPEGCAQALRLETAAVEHTRRLGHELEAAHARERAERLEDAWRTAVKIAWETYPDGLPTHIAGWEPG